MTDPNPIYAGPFVLRTADLLELLALAKEHPSLTCQGCPQLSVLAENCMLAIRDAREIQVRHG